MKVTQPVRHPSVCISGHGSIIPDPRLLAAIVDRLTFHAHMIETGTQSHRLRSTRATKGRTKRA